MVRRKQVELEGRLRGEGKKLNGKLEFPEARSFDYFDYVVGKVFDQARAGMQVEELKSQLRARILEVADQYPRVELYVKRKIGKFINEVFEGVNGEEFDPDDIRTQALAYMRMVFPRLYGGK